jgi:hypothetical protein
MLNSIIKKIFNKLFPKPIIYKFYQNDKKMFNIPSEISEKDHLLRFLIEDCSIPSKEEAVKHYFENGFESATKLKNIIDSLYPDKDKKINLLEFASGYGMVTRFFKKVIPSLDVTACDIHPDAMSFIESKMKVKTILSDSIPEKLSISDKYDVIFALSFFSHMPKTTWSRWIKVLTSKVKTGGFLIFTTHGMISKKLCIKNANPDKEGFWFFPGSEQKDINKDEYGTTLVTYQFVSNQLKIIGSCNIVEFKEGFWWGHQDLYIVKVV